MAQAEEIPIERTRDLVVSIIRYWLELDECYAPEVIHQNLRILHRNYGNSVIRNQIDRLGDKMHMRFLDEMLRISAGHRNDLLVLMNQNSPLADLKTAFNNIVTGWLVNSNTPVTWIKIIKIILFTRALMNGSLVEDYQMPIQNAAHCAQICAEVILQHYSLWIENHGDWTAFVGAASQLIIRERNYQQEPHQEGFASSPLQLGIAGNVIGPSLQLGQVGYKPIVTEASDSHPGTSENVGNVAGPSTYSGGRGGYVTVSPPFDPYLASTDESEGSPDSSRPRTKKSNRTPEYAYTEPDPFDLEARGEAGFSNVQRQQSPQKSPTSRNRSSPTNLSSPTYSGFLSSTGRGSPGALAAVSPGSIGTNPPSVGQGASVSPPSSASLGAPVQSPTAARCREYDYSSSVGRHDPPEYPPFPTSHGTSAGSPSMAGRKAPAISLFSASDRVPARSPFSANDQAPARSASPVRHGASASSPSSSSSCAPASSPSPAHHGTSASSPFSAAWNAPYRFPPPTRFGAPGSSSSSDSPGTTASSSSPASDGTYGSSSSRGYGSSSSSPFSPTNGVPGSPLPSTGHSTSVSSPSSAGRGAPYRFAPPTHLVAPASSSSSDSPGTTASSSSPTSDGTYGSSSSGGNGSSSSSPFSPTDDVPGSPPSSTGHSTSVSSQPTVGRGAPATASPPSHALYRAAASSPSSASSCAPASSSSPAHRGTSASSPSSAGWGAPYRFAPPTHLVAPASSSSSDSPGTTASSSSPASDGTYGSSSSRGNGSSSSSPFSPTDGVPGSPPSSTGHSTSVSSQATVGRGAPASFTASADQSETASSTRAFETVSDPPKTPTPPQAGTSEQKRKTVAKETLQILMCYLKERILSSNQMEPVLNFLIPHLDTIFPDSPCKESNANVVCALKALAGTMMSSISDNYNAVLQANAEVIGAITDINSGLTRARYFFHDLVSRWLLANRPPLSFDRIALLLELSSELIYRVGRASKEAGLPRIKDIVTMVEEYFSQLSEREFQETGGWDYLVENCEEIQSRQNYDIPHHVASPPTVRQQPLSLAQREQIRERVIDEIIRRLAANESDEFTEEDARAFGAPLEFVERVKAEFLSEQAPRQEASTSRGPEYQGSGSP